MTEELETKETADEIQTEVKPELPEAPASMNITVYYEGFKIQLTQRDPNTKLMPYVENAMAMIKWAKVQGFKPSWNEDTNKVTQPTDAQRTNGFLASLEPTKTYKCEKCGSEAVYKEGTGKTGRPWKGIFCTNEACKEVKWTR